MFGIDDAAFAALAGTAVSAIGGFSKNSTAKKEAKKAWLRNETSAERLRSWQDAQYDEQRAWEAEQASTAMQFESGQAERQMQFQEASNAKQMEFQRSMSSTAHQREVEDLRAAGLNPILSGTGGMGSSTPVGASSAGSMARGSKGSSGAPSGAAGSAVAAQIVDSLTPAIASAVSVGRVVSDISKTQADIEKVGAERLKIIAETDTEKMRPELIRAQVGLAVEQAVKSEIERGQKLPVEIRVLEKTVEELGSRINQQASQERLNNKLGGKVTEETLGLETDRFIRKQINSIEQKDLPDGVNLNFVQSALMYLFQKK